jgi:hypothetical protein
MSKRPFTKMPPFNVSEVSHNVTHIVTHKICVIRFKDSFSNLPQSHKKETCDEKAVDGHGFSAAPESGPDGFPERGNVEWRVVSGTHGGAGRATL